MTRGFYNGDRDLEFTVDEKELLTTILIRDGAHEAEIPLFLLLVQRNITFYDWNQFLMPPPPRRMRDDVIAVHHALRTIRWKLPFLCMENQDRLMSQIRNRLESDPDETQLAWYRHTVDVLIPSVDGLLLELRTSNSGRPRKLERDDFLCEVAAAYARAFGLRPKPDRYRPFDNIVAALLEILGEPLEDRFRVLQRAIRMAEDRSSIDWDNLSE